MPVGGGGDSDAAFLGSETLRLYDEVIVRIMVDAMITGDDLHIRIGRLEDGSADLPYQALRVKHGWAQVRLPDAVFAAVTAQAMRQR